MWLDLNGSASLNYIHFTCHLVFKNRNRCSLGEKKTEPASAYNMPEKGQTHLHQKYAAQILERWLQQPPTAPSYSLTGAACSAISEKQATAFEKKKKSFKNKKANAVRQSWILLRISPFFFWPLFRAVFTERQEVAHRQGPAVKKKGNFK